MPELSEVQLRPDRFYGRRDIALLLDVDERVVAAMIAAGTLPAIKAGTRDRVLGQVILDLAKGNAK